MKELPSNRPVVIIQYLSNIHYRKSLFDILNADSCPFDFRLICDNTNPYGVKSYPIPEERRISNIYLGPLVWQKGMLKKTLKLKPKVVVMLGVDPHIVSSLFYFWALKFKGIKVIWWGHGTLGKQGYLGRWIRLMYYNLASATMVYSEMGKNTLVRHGINEKSIHSIGNCINFEDYGLIVNPSLSEKKSTYKPTNRVKLLFSGRITEQRRFDILIEALSKIDQNLRNRFVIEIVGSGPYEPTLRRLVSSEKMEHLFTFHGAKYGKDTEEAFLNADFFILPGSIGLAIYHACSYGLPVITHGDFETQKPEAESLNFSGNEFLFNKGSADSLKSRLEFLLTINEDHYRKASREFMAIAKQNMPDVMSRNFISVIENVLKKK